PGDVCLCYSHDHAFRHSGDGCQTQRLSGQAPFPKEIAGSQKCDHRFLPLLGDDGLLDLAALNVENRIRGFALREDNLILPIIGNSSPPVHFRQKHFGIERGLLFALHSRPFLSPRVTLTPVDRGGFTRSQRLTPDVLFLPRDGSTWSPSRWAK